MPPSFAPKERRRKRKTRPPSEPKSVDDIVKDIEREYRDQMRKRGLVDSWGQPIKRLDTRQLKEDVQRELETKEKQERRAVRRTGRRNLSKSVASSLSEAIGTRYKEKESKRESSERTATSEKRSIPKDDQRHKETSESPNEGQDNRKSLKRYKVKIYEPQIRDVKFKTGESLSKYIDQELSGMKHLPNFKKIENDAKAQIKLRQLVRDRRTLELNEIRSLSEQVKLPFRTTRHYVGKEGRPELYRLAEKAITKSEAQSILGRIHSTLGDIRSHSDVETKLKKDGVLDHLRSLSSYERDNGMVHKYFKFLDALSEGGIMRDITRRVGVSEGTGITWTKGVFPSHIKRALGIHDSGTSPDRKIQDTSADTRLAGKIAMQLPEIKGVPIESEKHLRSLLAKDYKGMIDMPGADKMFHEAIVHLRIMDRLKGREFLEYGEIPRLAREFVVKKGTLDIWIRKGTTPRFYFYINQSISKSDAIEKLTKVREKNNGLLTLEEYNRRMKNYYLWEQEKKASFHKRESVIIQNYFKFMERYKQGGLLEHIAKGAGIAPSTGRGWLEGLQPRRIRIVAGIPKAQPKPGHLWLPLKFIDGKYPTDFIDVPTKIQSYKDILPVLKKLKPIQSDYLQELNSKYGRRPVEEEFMYLLGSYLSDAGVFNKTTISQSMGIRLSAKYPWSIAFGEGFCQSLGVCGIYAHRVENTPAKTSYMRTKHGLREINQKEKFNWSSENSPLVRWINQACLGFADNVPKREQHVSADWILSSPKRFRVSFIQGWSDGDGSASPRGRYICISTTKNQNFAHRLLKSLGIDARITGSEVFTSGMENARLAARIPTFRYATERQDAAEKMVKMIEANRNIRSNPLNREEIEYMTALRRSGLSWWDIHELVFDKLGTSIHRETIERAVCRHCSGDPLDSIRNIKERE
ncbi:MAG: hypothetical protein AM326_03290 [Candidatus Thorarchaeota archaeon SMTZ-45]|nr:MAG: hypothetical protein AM326_03290 [Candidatus Thorarchaeota archaeon SMTZ-45]